MENKQQTEERKKASLGQLCPVHSNYDPKKQTNKLGGSAHIPNLNCRLSKISRTLCTYPKTKQNNRDTLNS